MLSVFAGGAVFSDFQRGAPVPVPFADDGATVHRRVSASPSAAVAAGVGYWLSDGVAVRAMASLAPSRFEVRPAELAEQPYGGTPVQYAQLGIWLLDVDLLVRIPLRYRAKPYGIVGLGAVTYAARPVPDAPIPAGAPAAFGRRAITRPAGVLGAGVLVPVHGFALDFQVTDHVAPAPGPPPGGGQGTVGFVSHLRALVGATLFPRF